MSQSGPSGAEAPLGPHGALTWESVTCNDIFKLYPPSSPHQPQPVDAAPDLAPLGAETNKDKGSERGSSCIHPHSTRSTPKPHYGGHPPYPWARGLQGRSRAASLHLLLLPGPSSAIWDSESPLRVATGHPLCPPLSPPQGTSSSGQLLSAWFLPFSGEE